MNTPAAAPRLRLPLRLVIFDLGSTLIYEKDSWDAFFPRADDALWSALRAAGVTVDRREVYGNHQSLFSVYAEQRGYDLSERTALAVLDDILRRKGFQLPQQRLQAAIGAMFAVTQENWLPEEDAIPTLQVLRSHGLHTALISNASDDDNTQALINKGGFRPYLEYIVSSASYGKRKPHLDIFRSVLGHFAMPAYEAVMVGDDYEADVLGAKKAGMQSIWITRRAYQNAPDTARGKPTATVTTLGEIPVLVLE